MATLGEKLMERDPARYGQRDPEELNAMAIERLNNPETRPKTLAHLRTLFPKSAALDDDTFASKALGDAGYKPVADESASPPTTEDQALRIQRNARIKGAKPVFEKNIQAGNTILRDPGETPEVKGYVEDQLRNGMSVPEALNPRLPEVDPEVSWKKTLAEKQARGLVAVNQGEGGAQYFPNIQFQNPNTGVAESQLRPGASYDARDVKGMPGVTMDHLTGAADRGQQGVTELAARLYDPDAPEGERWFRGERDAKGNKVPWLPRTKEEYLAQPADPVSWLFAQAKGRGYPEYARNAGQNFGEQFPETAKAGAKVGGTMAAGGAMLAAGVDKLEEYLNRIPGAVNGGNQYPTFDRWAQENKKESADYWDKTKSLVGGVLPGGLPDNPEVGRLAGGAVGKMGGEGLQAMSPTGASELLGAGVKLAAPPVKEALRAAAGVLEGGGKSAVTQAIGKVTSPVYHAVGSVISDAASAAPLSLAERSIINTGGAVKRGAGELFAREKAQQIAQQWAERRPDATPQQIAEVEQLVKRNWNTPERRLAAVTENPLAKDAFEILQPMHEETYRAAFPNRPGYNPYHVFYGQDISMANRRVENGIQRQAINDEAFRALEDQKSVGETIHPSANRGVPGIDDNMLARMSSDPEYESKVAALMDEVRTHGDAMSAARAKDPAFGPVAGYASEGKPAMGQDFMDLAGKRWEAAKKLEEMQKKGPTYQVVPRMGRAAEDTLEEFIREGGSDGVGYGRNLKQLNAGGGIISTAKEIAEGNGLGSHEALKFYQEKMPELHAANPKSYMPAQDWFQQAHVKKMLGDAPLTDGPAINVIRHDAGEGERLSRPATEALRRENQVILKVNPVGTDFTKLRDVSNTRSQRAVIVSIPGGPETKWMDGMVVDRRFAQAIIEQRNPSLAMEVARKGAQWVDNIFGLSQLNKAITRGNPGFEARNRESEIMRLYLYDPSIKDKFVADLVGEVTNAPIGKYGRYIPELGMTAGEAHREVLRLGSVGRGISAEAMGLEHQLPGAMWQGEGFRKAVDFMNKPGEMVGDAHNMLIRQGMFPKLAKEYSTEDGMRFMSMLNQMRHGVSPHIAANEMRALLIDFGDRNAVETFLKPAVPFIKYYTGAVGGVLDLAMKNPRRFSRMYDAMRVRENYDTDTHGGQAINRKLKSLSDRAGASPVWSDGKDGPITASRMETTAAEGAGLLDSIYGSLNGRDQEGDKGIWATLGPGLSNPWEYATGKTPSTNRNVFGISPEAFERLQIAHKQGPAAWSLAPRLHMAKLLYEQQQRDASGNKPYVAGLGAHPDAALAYQALMGLKGNPFIDAPARAIGQPWVNTAIRGYLGTPNPASRSTEKVDATMLRALVSYLTGMRSGTIDPTNVMSQDQRRMADPKAGGIPTPRATTIKKAGKQGQLTFPGGN